MKSRTLPFLRLSIAASAALTLSAQAASDIWIDGTEGDYSDSANWQGGNVPNGAADDATINGVGPDNASVVNFGETDNVILNALNLAPQNAAPNLVTFNQTGGSLEVATLKVGANVGASKNAVYNMTGGTLNVTAEFTFGNGGATSFNLGGGTSAVVNSAGLNVQLGTADGAVGTLSIASGGTFNHTGGGQVAFGTGGAGDGFLTMTGGSFISNASNVRFGTAGNASSTGTGVLSGDASFTADAATTMYFGNNGASGSLTLSDNASFSVAAAVVSLGQFGGGSGTITMSGNSSFTAAGIAVGGANATSAVTGVIHLNGGTLSAGFIQLGNSSVTPSSTQNVLLADGGTVRATAANSNYFGAYSPLGLTTPLRVEILAGGLTFDTNGNDVTITNGDSFVGEGAFTKAGAGILTLSGQTAFTGATVVQNGSLLLMGSLGASESLTMETGTSLLLSGENALNDTIQLTLNEGVTVDFLGTGLEAIGGLEINGVTLEEGTYDITYLQTNFGSAITFTGVLSTGFEVIPEPGTVALLAAGGFGLLIASRRRRRA